MKASCVLNWQIECVSSARVARHVYIHISTHHIIYIYVYTLKKNNTLYSTCMFVEKMSENCKKLCRKFAMLKEMI